MSRTDLTSEVRVYQPKELDVDFSRIRAGGGSRSKAWDDDLRWLSILREGLGHQPYLLAASADEPIWLPLALVRSRFFGRFLVSLPYLNSAGIHSAVGSLEATEVSEPLIDEAVRLADALDVKYLELRQEQPISHRSLTHTESSKVHMRLALPSSEDELWSGWKSKVRNELRKGDKQGFEVAWGGCSLLPEFYSVFSQNMRDLGTPVYGRKLFRAILQHFPGQAELCVIRLQTRPAAAALLIHGSGSTQVPSASSLRAYNSRNANMFMYWQLLRRAVERGSRKFDFGRSTIDSNTYRFKRQWGAEPVSATWQYYLRRGQIDDARPHNPKFDRLIRTWRRLPLWLTRAMGPLIVRGIP